MDRIVCYVPSYNDSQLVAESVATVPEWDVVISDNASDEPHRSRLGALAGERVHVIHQPRQLGRVGNWRFCIAHFIASGAPWMKLLPAGDRHKPDSLALCHRAISQRGDARLIVCNVEFALPDKRLIWSLAQHPLWLSPPQALLKAVRRGNVFCGLLNCLVHVETVRDSFAFGEEALSYCADMLFLLNIARRATTMFYPEVIAEFVAANRKTFSVNHNSLEHLLEEALMRLRAADYYAELTGDYKTRNEAVPLIAGWLRGGLQRSPEILIGGRR